MLYISTRNNKDAHTAYKTLVSDYAGDGGVYVPFRLPHYNQTEIAALVARNFGETVADILNYFFSAQLTGWDVDFSIGRNPLKLVSMNRKIVVAETWHNPQTQYSYITKSLFDRIRKDENAAKQPTDWVKIAIKIAVLFGVCGEMMRIGILESEKRFDVAVHVDDFSEAMAAWYARQMGLPIGVIICSCDESGAIWDLIHRGELNTGLLSEALRTGVERLLSATFGINEVERYRGICAQRGMYAISEITLDTLNHGLFSAVIGKSRVASVINSVYRTNAYIIDPATAVPYGGIQDYRARAGESNLTLLFAEQDPLASVEAIKEATGLKQEELLGLCRKS